MIDSSVIDAVRKLIENTIDEHQKFRDTPYWSMHKTPVRQALEGAQQELRRLKDLHDQWCRETRQLHVPQPSPMDAEIRTALRGMSAKERDAILSDPSTQVLNAVLYAPAFLSGITVERQNQMREDAIVRLYAEEWKQQEAEGAALKELQDLVQIALQNLTEKPA